MSKENNIKLEGGGNLITIEDHENGVHVYVKIKDGTVVIDTVVRPSILIGLHAGLAKWIDLQTGKK